MRIASFLTAILLTAAITGMFTSCEGKSKEAEISIAVFVPGFLEGSPTYEMMDTGVRKAAEDAEADVEVKTIEGGFDQATWTTQITALTAAARYDIIVTSNAAMSEICAAIADSYPDQDFLVLDGSGLAGPGVIEVVYNHLEQAFLNGYFAGLATTSTELDGANASLKVGMIVGQRYPQMNQQIQPGFEIGLHAVNPDIELEFRVLGNWYDAQKARELADGLISEGVDVILTIAGGANEGVIAAAKETGTYVLWFDSDGTDIAPGTVLASATLAQDKVAEEWTKAWLNEELDRGEITKLGVKEGYVGFPLETKNMRRYVPDDIRRRMAGILEQMNKGILNLRVLG